jgi:hypothetical protein
MDHLIYLLLACGLCLLGYSSPLGRKKKYLARVGLACWIDARRFHEMDLLSREVALTMYRSTPTRILYGRRRLDDPFIIWVQPLC